MVNTAKCEIIVFGSPNNANYRFKFGGSQMPVVNRCKYLGIYFDRITLLGAHAEHLVASFQNAVSAFFRLGRKLDLADLKTWGMLQSSLLFSVLYGVELLEDLDISSSLSLTYRKALRSFLGLPNKVSNDVLDLIFPDFSFPLFILKRKHGFLRRMVEPCSTLAPVFFLEDRLDGLSAGRGFSATLWELLRSADLEELIWSVDRDLANFGFDQEQDRISDSKWVKMAGSRSTRLLSVTFGERHLWREFLVFAAQHGRACLRIVMVTWTGCIEISTIGTSSRKCPFCNCALDSRHFLLCGKPAAFQLNLTTLARHTQWSALMRTTLDTYFRFLFRYRPSVLSADEARLFSWEEQNDPS
jgi:hypothetical protein